METGVDVLEFAVVAGDVDFPNDGLTIAAD
jgi:hypothetical protein